jgi:hypothetical protein
MGVEVMAEVIFIMGESGTGKSTSLRNLDCKKSFLIQVLQKSLPFKSSDWINVNDSKNGNVCCSDNNAEITKAMVWAVKKGKKIIVIDDFQYMMANEFMRRHGAGIGNAIFQLYNDIADNVWRLLKEAKNLPEDVRVYILTHSQTRDDGFVKVKTIGKLLDDKINLEGMVTIVLRSGVNDGSYLFSTQSNGNDCVKTPIGMFDKRFVDNDLSLVDKAICNYYSIDDSVFDEKDKTKKSSKDELIDCSEIVDREV